jgi:D-beta-D-heptose 7-phosphate kinase/D-beta-D-heptose 1-phosphate adenosyltransferase|tara:strand:+ start:1708 stop:2856 length:1149 start_codon:yes stop_codon:yes gene_type:complete
MKVLVLGDVIIDKYIYGTSTRISPEAPVPVITYIEEKETRGGAGLVYENLKSLGVDVDMFETPGQISVKTRIICDGHYITRIDDDAQADSTAVLQQVLATNFSQYEYVVLSDYNKGVLDEARDIIKHINTFGCKIIVDPKENFWYYENAWLVKPNYSEFESLEFDSWYGNIITTNAGDEVIATIDGKKYEIPVDNVEVSDVTGAGDCFLAGFVYALTQGYDYGKSLKLAVRGSTESVKHSGTYILKKDDLEDVVVWTNGVFDILHIGHLKLLRHAHSLGNRLIVGINSDASVKRLKGDLRPINDETTRKEVLLELGFVDDVIIFDEDTPLEAMTKLEPDIIVKGGDYTFDTVVGNHLAKVIIFPTVEGHSTTSTIKKIDSNN